MSSAIAVTNSRTRSLPIITIISVVALAAAHWFLTIYCHISYEFSGVWFPFAFTESPDHQMWKTAVTATEFPIAALTRVAGMAESDLHGFMQILNSLVWGVLICFGSTRLIRRLRRG